MSELQVEPLWPRGRIVQRQKELMRSMPTLGAAIAQLTLDISDEYEAKLNDYQGTYLYYIDLAEKTEARIMELEHQLASATPSGASEMWMPVAVNDLTYHMGKQSYMLGGQPIDMLDLPSHLRLCRSTPAPALPSPLDDLALNLLSALASGYLPAWNARLGGYKCAYCGVLIRVDVERERYSLHREDCSWTKARKLIDAIIMYRQRPAAQTGEVTNG